MTQQFSLLHRRVPTIRAGVTMEYAEAASQTTVAKALIAASDVAIFMHYPFGLDAFIVAPATITRITFDNMIALAGGKPVVLQELGYPAGSSALSACAMQTARREWRGAR